jgi:acyl-CoA synthetase (AMP-forming)/AMP-acid ligase II
MLVLQPYSIFMYPHVAAWLAKQNEELKMLRETNFLRRIYFGGWVLDTASADALFEALPNTFLQQLYGMTEKFCSTLSSIEAVPQKMRRCIQEGNGNTDKSFKFVYLIWLLFLFSHYYNNF